MNSKFHVIAIFLCLGVTALYSQSFYFGADLTYVNEMDDCGAVYAENGVAKDAYNLFADHGTNLVRIRLWHTPTWYDQLNEGNRYGDLADAKRSIARAKASGMDVLLDFHLSDSWADPSKQLVPAAWLSVVDDLELLKDSLYQYLHGSLMALAAEDLLPEMIQIGNEVNKGILLSPEDNAVWTLEWDRNAALFNEALRAVADFENTTGEDIKTVLHVAAPAEATHLLAQFWENGVRDFDIFGLSYYWTWHQPTTIAQTGQIIRNLKATYPDQDIMVVETGYIWTIAGNDNANNIMGEGHPAYEPLSPTQQRNWLTDMAQEVIDAGGLGLIYWEPAWVSTGCFTRWGQGSHQENAAFFDFSGELMIPGGIEWMTQDYGLTNLAEGAALPTTDLSVSLRSDELVVMSDDVLPTGLSYEVRNINGQLIRAGELNQSRIRFTNSPLVSGIYFVVVTKGSQVVSIKKVVLSF